MGAAAGLAGELVSPVVAVSGLVPALVAGGDIAGIIVAVDDAVLQGGVRPKVADAGQLAGDIVGVSLVVAIAERPGLQAVGALQLGLGRCYR